MFPSSADLVVFLQASVQLLQSVQVELLLQLSRLAQVLQHLLREATWEAAADLIDHGALQPHVSLSQQSVTQVVPEERERDLSYSTFQHHVAVVQKPSQTLLLCNYLFRLAVPVL